MNLLHWVRALRHHLFVRADFRPLCLLTVVALAVPLAPTAARAQNNTSSSLTGLVTDATGAPVAGATVAVKHEPTGTAYETITRANGRYLLNGLRVGGPYTINVGKDGFKAANQGELVLLLQTEKQQDFRLEAEGVVQMEKFTVTAERDTRFGADTIGGGTTVGSELVANLPNFNRSIADVARLDPRISVEIDNLGATTISAGGQNNRFNTIQVDGVAANDEFGLNDSGVPAHGNPLSFDTIDQITISTSPYDVTQAGFTGASINAVTKGGTNEFHGSAYLYYRDRDYFGDNPRFATTASLDPLNTFEERTWGATLGGPIFKDRLFFFGSYEEVERTEVLPNSVFEPDTAAVTAVRNAFRSLSPSYDPGESTPPADFKSTDQKTLAKVDWNISRQHRLTYRYNLTVGDRPQIRNFGFRAGGFEQRSLSEHWFVEKRESENHVAQLFSNWSPDLSGQLKVARTKYATVFDIGQPFPQVEVRGVADSRAGQPAGALRVGTEEFRQKNQLNTTTTQAALGFTYTRGNHTLSAGFDWERNEIYNVFQRQALTTWTFASLADFLASAAGATGRAVNFTWDYTLPGKEVAAAWEYDSVGLYVQDKWQVNPKLVLHAGLRLDTPVVDAPPDTNQFFQPVFGLRNNHTIDGNSAFQPRLGFNWAVDDERRTQVRGGAGLFYGTSPGVWLSNNYTNTGVNRRVQSLTGAATPAFRGDYATAVTPPPDAALPVGMNVDALDPSFQLPTNWKANFAVDHKLPFWDLILSFEADWSWVDQAIAYRELARTSTQRLPDGRARMTGNVSPQFNTVFLLTNTDQGSSTNYTFMIERPMKRKWSARLAYTYGSSKDINSGRSAQASSNWDRLPVFDYNEQVLAPSDFEARYRVLGVVTREFEFVKNTKTTLALVYDGQAGRPFSYVFDNNVNNSPDTRDNDLFYVPLRTDPIVRYATPADEAAINAYIDSRPALAAHRGRVFPRNGARNPALHRWDLKFTQDLRFSRQHKVQLTLDFINFGNLLNDDWGRTFRSDFPGILSFVNVTNAATAATQGFYTYQASINGNSNSAEQLRDTIGESRWSILAGVKYSF
jgi:hypothetical protein